MVTDKNLYELLIRPVLFKLPPETSHKFSILMLKQPWRVKPYLAAESIWDLSLIHI